MELITLAVIGVGAYLLTRPKATSIVDSGAGSSSTSSNPVIRNNAVLDQITGLKTQAPVALPPGMTADNLAEVGYSPGQISGIMSGTIEPPNIDFGLEEKAELATLAMGSDILPGIKVTDPSSIVVPYQGELNPFVYTELQKSVDAMARSGRTRSEIVGGIAARAKVSATGSWAGYNPAVAIVSFRDGSQQVMLYAGDEVPSNAFQLETNPEGVLPWVDDVTPGYTINFDSAYAYLNPPGVRDILIGLGLKV